METLKPTDRGAWRAWLKENHLTSEGIWLIVSKKHSGEGGVLLADAVEEALCFGWIDGRLKAVDEKCFRLHMSRRKPASIWSKINKQRVGRLSARGLMSASGIAVVKAAKKDGSWNKLDAIDELRFSDDFEKALAANQLAKDNFLSFSNSAKRAILWWIESVKRPENRLNRIERAVAAAEKGRADPFSVDDTN